MIFDYGTLKIIWLFIIGFIMMGFAITGGADLGVGVLIPTLGRNDDERKIILRSIGPTWEGNQVWLITGGAAIFAAWPFVYATLFSSLYFALLIVLLALILRPPGIDYREKIISPFWRQFWDWSLGFSGFVPALLFGVVFGNVFLGFPFTFDESLRSHYTGSLISLLTPFPILCGMFSLSLLLTQGALFLQLKTKSTKSTKSSKTSSTSSTPSIPTSDIAKRAKVTALLFTILAFILFMICFYWTTVLPGAFITDMPDINSSFNPLMKTVEVLPGHWFLRFDIRPMGWYLPGFILLSFLFTGILTFLNFSKMAILFNSINLILIIFLVGFMLYPFILPSTLNPNHGLTIWDATSSYLTLTWMFWGVVIFFPIVLSYTIWVFKIMFKTEGKY